MSAEVNWLADVAQLLPPPRKFRLVKGDDFASAEPPQWHIKGVIPRTSEPVGLYGDSGVGKTFLAVDMALAIARGVPWHDKRTTRGRVVWIAAENPEGMRQRLAAYRKHYGCDLPIEVMTQIPRFDMREHVEQLAADIGDCDVIFVDHLTAVKGAAKLNSDMEDLMNGVKLLSKLTSATVVVIHHEGKNAAAGAKGGSEFRSFAQALLHVKVDNTVNTSVLVNEKLREGAKGAKFFFKLHYVELGIDDDGDSFGSCVVEQTVSQAMPPMDLKPEQHKLWGVVASYAEEGATIEDILGKITLAGKRPETQMRQRLQRLLDHPSGRFTKDGERYYVDRMFGGPEQ